MLLGCQGDGFLRLSFSQRFGALEINLAIFQGYHRSFAFVGPAKDRRDEDQLFWEKGFDHVIVCTKSKAFEFVFLFTAGGQEQDRIVSVFSKYFHQGESVAVGKHHVKDCQFWAECTGSGQGLPDTSGGSYLCEAFVLQDGGDHILQTGFIVYEQYSFILQIF